MMAGFMVGDRVREVPNRFWTREPREGVVVELGRDIRTRVRWEDGSEGHPDMWMMANVTVRPAATRPLDLRHV